MVLAGATLEHTIFPYSLERGIGNPFGVRTPVVRKNLAVSPASSYRAGKTLRRLVDANIGKYLRPNGTPFRAVFLTLTFRDSIRDMGQANGYFTLGIQRLNYDLFKTKTNKLKYVAVPEFQDKNRSGVIHYHVLFFNLPYMHRIYDRIRDIWSYGHVNVQSVARVKSVSSYLSKYLTKSATDPRLAGYKKYFASKGLFKPLVVRASETIDLLASYIKDLPPQSVYSFKPFEGLDTPVERRTYHIPLYDSFQSLFSLFAVPF